MPVVVHCPSCSGPLRVGDDLIGRKVRCPSCDETFAAPAPAAPPADAPPPEAWLDLNPEPAASAPASAPPPVETVPVDPWRAMDLSLDVPEAPPPAPPGPVGAREIEREEVPEAPRRDDGRRARLTDDHDDTRPCPVCDKLVHRDARRCSWCGERFDEDGPRHEPVRRDGGYRRPSRRDSEPHRGGAVMVMGILSVVTPFVGFVVCIIPWFAGIVLGVVAWVMGGTDLAKMRRGEMDPDGQANTRAGYVCGIIGVILNVLVILGVSGFIAFAIMMEASRARPQPKWGAPPPVKR